MKGKTMTDTTVELSFKKATTPSSKRYLAEYVCGDYSVTKEEGSFNGITWVARYKGVEKANFPRLTDGKRWCSEDSEKRTKAQAEQAIEKAKQVPTADLRVMAAVAGYNLATPPMPNSERVQKYARQNNIAGVISGAVYPQDKPKLTPKQMRRVRKNMLRNLATDTLAIAPMDSRTRATLTPENGYSLLARTPEGAGIFHQFSN